MIISGNFERFQYFNLTNFLENDNLFQKTGVTFESIEIEKTIFLYKTAISEANVKTNRMVSIKSTYHKEWSFASNYFIFLKILFQFKNLLKGVDCTNYPNVRIPTFRKCWSFEGAFFPVSIFKGPMV